MKKAIYSKVAGSLLLSAGLFASGVAAADETITLNSGGVGIFGITHTAGDVFADTFLFSLTPEMTGWAAGSAAVGITNLNGVFTPNLDITNIVFFSEVGGVRTELATTFNDGEGITFYPSSALAAGNYGFTVTGTVTADVQAASYAGNLSVSPVPEPATYAMLGVGIGLLAFTARRKTNNKLG
jgi:hypothetical protein